MTGVIIRRAICTLLLASGLAADEPYRPPTDAFPAAEQARALRGELVFVDHVNRRGSLRLQINGHFREGRLHHFAMLPYGEIYYHGAPAELRDIPLGTVLYGQFYRPPDTATSVVPPVRGKDPTAPPENHAILLQDDVSLSRQQNVAWQLGQIAMNGDQGELTARRDLRPGQPGLGGEHRLTVDGSTRVWRGRELLGIADLQQEGLWPQQGERALDQTGWIALTWHPRYLYQQFHVADIWLDERAVRVAAERQRQTHIRHIRTRWMPARVEAVDYEEFGAAVVTVQLFGGMDDSLYADFQPRQRGKMAAAENTLRTWWPDHDGMDGTILTVERTTLPAGKQRAPGGSGIRVRFQVPLILEGFRPGRVVRLRPASWPNVKPPYEERVRGFEDRWPSTDVFNK